MTKVIELCLKNRVTIIILTCILLVSGIYVARMLPIDIFPELKVSRVTVQTEAPGLTAEEVEQYITIPLEASLSGATGVRDVRSSSGSGLSFVWVDFDWDMDPYLARQIVSERIEDAKAAIPEEYTSELAPIVSVTGEIMLIAITGSEEPSPLEMRRIAEYSLRNRLLSIPGVGQVTVLGGRLPEYQVQYDPMQLRQANVSLDSLIAAVQNAQSLLPAGYLENVSGQELSLQQSGRMKDISQLQQALIGDHESRTLRIGDIANVQIDGAPRRGGASFNGQEAVILSIQKTPGANTLDLTKKIDASLEEFRQSQLPAGMQIHADAYRQSDFIHLSLEQGGETIIEAAIVVILVIFLTLLNMRTAIIALLSMPLSILLAVIFFPMFDLAINIMTLGGLAVAVGDVVDNAIIFIEISWRKLKENALLPSHERKPKLYVLLHAKKEIVNSISFSTVIILLVFTPILFLSGIEGQFFKPLGISFMLALMASLIVALTIIPVLCYIAFRNPKNTISDPTEATGHTHQESFTVALIKRTYTPMLDYCLKHSKTVCASTMALTIAALALAYTYGTSFLPPFNEDCYTVFVSTVPGTSLDETERISMKAMEDIRRIPGVISVAQRAGRAENDEHAEPVSASELLVRVDLSQDQKVLRDHIQRVIGGIPGTSTLIGYPLAHRISSALSGSASEIAINIYGNDLAQIRIAASKAKDILSSLPEVADARANREVMVDSINIRYRAEALASAGFTMADAGKQVSTAINGLKLGEVIDNQDRWNIVLRLDPSLKESVDDIRALQLVSPNGRIVQIQEVADVTREESSNLILRDKGRRKAMISCNPAPKSNLGDLALACRKKLDPAMHELGCTVEYAGTIEARESAANRLYLIGAAALILIIMLLSISLGSMKKAALTLINIPLCLIGGIVAVFIVSPAPPIGNFFALITGGDYIPPILSVSSIVGFITVIGFAIRSGLIMQNRYKELEKEHLDPVDAIRAGSLERVVPIIMTSLTTIFGLLPIIWAIDKPGGELLGPLALVQFGGLVSATILILLVLPASSRLVLAKNPARNNE